MFASTISHAAPFLQMWDGGHMGDGWGWAGWLTMTLAMALFWGAVVAVVLVVVRSAGQQPGSNGPAPLDIARARYARGEITDEEFERIKRNLG